MSRAELEAMRRAGSEGVLQAGSEGVPQAGPEPREVGSPCISICVIDPGLGYCIGCMRTLDEIADWINLDSASRLAVWEAIATRRRKQHMNAEDGGP